VLARISEVFECSSGLDANVDLTPGGGLLGQWVGLMTTVLYTVTGSGVLMNEEREDATRHTN